MTPTINSLHDGIQSIAEAWKLQRAERQARRSLDPVDFGALRDVGLLRAAVPADMGGLWVDSGSSARMICELLRELAGGDPAVALVSAMHPAVISYWLLNPDASQPAWEAQRRAVFASAAAGEQWGTITSEPGSGGDIGRTKATATPTDDAPFLAGRAYAVSGDKHFGSGSGVADRMITTAIPDGEDEPAMFVLDATDRRWDGSAGWTLIGEWDGVGMAATQSHAMRLQGAPAMRVAHEGPLADITAGAGALLPTLFTAVIVGVLDEAVRVAKKQLRPKADELRAYEQVEWTRAVNDHWLAVQAYEGSLRAIEADDPGARFAALCAKEAVAELAESILSRLAKVIGGGTFSRRSPFAHWYEDVRALGFLRPPWGLAFDNLFALSFD
ncbi:MAG: acyl-CoA dehydrogenase family protein [Ilumatobacteraceae bacterium]